MLWNFHGYDYSIIGDTQLIAYGNISVCNSNLHPRRVGKWIWSRGIVDPVRIPGQAHGEIIVKKVREGEYNTQGNCHGPWQYYDPLLLTRPLPVTFNDHKEMTYDVCTTLRYFDDGRMLKHSEIVKLIYDWAHVLPHELVYVVVVYMGFSPHCLSKKIKTLFTITQNTKDAL